MPMDMPQEPMPQEPMPDMGMEQPQEENPMDYDGDDPKKEIQRKAGKISNELSNYQGEDKREIAKYVKGMIDKAADKIIDGDDVDAEQQPNNPDNGGAINAFESVVREIVNDIDKERGQRNTKRTFKKITNTAVKKNNPFVANR